MLLDGNVPTHRHTAIPIRTEIPDAAAWTNGRKARRKAEKKIIAAATGDK
jgi:hypothetical protein